MSGKRATRKSQGTTDPAVPPPSSATSSHKSNENGGEQSATSKQPTAPQRQTRNHQRHTDSLTQPSTLGEQEARRSSRATKGQHTKAFDQLENPQTAKKKGSSKKSKKAEKEEKEEEVEDEEIIRCACGATTQEDDDPNEPWIACEECGAWQHNVCMGMSIFDDDLPKEYFCEQCRPDDHKELLAAIARGEKLWLTRRQKHEEENKKKKTKKGKKRVSDTKDRSSPAASTTKSKPSPAPEVKKEDESAKGKRKSRDHSQGPASKLRKVSDARAVPALPKYTPPADLAESLDKLEGTRKKTADGIRKSLDVALEQAVKSKVFKVPKDTTKNAITERHAIEIERAVHDSHPTASSAANQIRTLVFNLKKNVELAGRVFNRTLTAPALAAMSSDDMQTEELQRKTAHMKELADKQSVLITDDGPRVRRTHKGEEIVENDSFMATEEVPSSIRRQSVRDTTALGAGKPVVEQEENSVELPANIGPGPLRVDTTGKQQSPRQSNFDLEKVFSTVKSPTGPVQRRPSAPAPSAGPGVDLDVDRMLQEDGDSPPYSPTENLDPDVVWQGHLKMTNLADFSIVAKFAGGANLKQVRGIEWKDLIPPLVTVAGRIPEDKAVPYLCGLRYNNQVDLVITSLAPANTGDAIASSQYTAVINYFQSKQRYGVVGERQLGGVRDTYLIPLPAGDGPLPEILENIDGHLVPQSRPQPILLMVFVVRDEQIPIDQSRQQAGPQQATPTPSVQATPTPAPERKPSVPAPTWSPATPQGAFPNSSLPPQGQHQSHTPIPPPVIPGQPAQPVPQRQAPAVAPVAAVMSQDANSLRQAQIEGEQKARQVLGPLFTSPTVTFLLPHAARMKEGEWNAVKRCIERDPRAREDLPLLSRLLTEEGNNAKQNGTSQPPAPTASPGVVQNTIAAAQATLPSGAPAATHSKV
ncbi:putative Transcription factor BYE1 [Seiridium cardinale]|uniref:Transcription factor BYE1 n=1 Tax=Seiridium cardinale TaxID=138064 RepID=A0ABR2XWG2_9PEZI